MNAEYLKYVQPKTKLVKNMCGFTRIAIAVKVAMQADSKDPNNIPLRTRTQ